MPNKENLRLWVEDLESGQHEQAELFMAKIQDEKTSYCCLGRLCEVAIANGVPLERTIRYFHLGYNHDMHYYDGHGGSIVPRRVGDWTGISPDKLAHYATLNDKGCTFSEIAQQIRTDYDL